MAQNLDDDRGIFNACPEPAEGAARMVNGPPHCGQVVMSMAKTRLSNWAQLIRARGEAAGGLVVPISDVRLRVGLTGHDLSPQRGIGREHAMKANEMEPWSRHKSSQALEEFQRGHDEMGGAIAIRGFELEDDLAGPGAAEPFVAQGRARDVPTQAFEFLPLLGATPVYRHAS